MGKPHKLINMLSNRILINMHHSIHINYINNRFQGIERPEYKAEVIHIRTKIRFPSHKQFYLRNSDLKWNSRIGVQIYIKMILFIYNNENQLTECRRDISDRHRDITYLYP